MEAVQKVVMIVFHDVDAARPTSHYSHQIVVHLDVWERRQIVELISFKQRDHHLSQTIELSVFVGVFVQGLESFGMMTQVQVRGEDDRVQGCQIDIVLCGVLDCPGREFDHTVPSAVLFQQFDDLEIVKGRHGGLFRDRGDANDVGDEGIDGDAFGSIQEIVHSFLWLAHLQQRHGQNELPGGIVPFTPGAQQTHILLNEQEMAVRQEPFGEHEIAGYWPSGKWKRVLKGPSKTRKKIEDKKVHQLGDEGDVRQHSTVPLAQRVGIQIHLRHQLVNMVGSPILDKHFHERKGSLRALSNDSSGFGKIQQRQPHDAIFPEKNLSFIFLRLIKKN